MELNHYLSILWRRKWVVIVALVAAIGVVAIGQTMTSPVYSAVTTLRVAASAGGTQIQTNYNERLMNTYVQIAASRPIMDELMDRLELKSPPNVRAEVVPNTELIRIVSESQDPEMAALAANTLAEILIEQSDQLYLGGAVNSQEILAKQVEEARTDLEAMRKEYESLVAEATPAPEQIAVASQLLQEKQRTYETLLRQHEQAQYREAVEASMMTIVESALVPNLPSQPRVGLNLTLAGLVGLAGGLILAFIIENMDNRLHTTPEIEAVAKLPVLARFPRTVGKHMLLSQNGITALAESVRHLAAQILLMGGGKPHKIFLLTGAAPGQGTSTAAANLAEALAEHGKNVVLVDANLRRPKLHELFGLSNEKGLTDVLSQSLDLEKAMQKSPDGRISLLTSGPVAGAPAPAFDPARTDSLISALRQKFDYVLLDTPALTVADMTFLAPYADALVLVTRRSHASRASVQSAGDFLLKYEDKFIGMIVNEAEGQGIRSY